MNPQLATNFFTTASRFLQAAQKPSSIENSTPSIKYYTTKVHPRQIFLWCEQHLYAAILENSPKRKHEIPKLSKIITIKHDDEAIKPLIRYHCTRLASTTPKPNIAQFEDIFHNYESAILPQLFWKTHVRSKIWNFAGLLVRENRLKRYSRRLLRWHSFQTLFPCPEKIELFFQIQFSIEFISNTDKTGNKILINFQLGGFPFFLCENLLPFVLIRLRLIDLFNFLLDTVPI